MRREAALSLWTFATVWRPLCGLCGACSELPVTQLLMHDFTVARFDGGFV